MSGSKTNFRNGVTLFISSLVITLVIAVIVFRSRHNFAAGDTADLSEVPARIGVVVIPAGELPSPQLFYRFRGEIRARRESQLAMRRSGRLLRVDVQEGDLVGSGQRLAWLDVSDLKVAIEVADAEVATSNAMLDEATNGPRKQTIEAAKSQVKSIEAQLVSAKRRLERQEELLSRDAGVEQEFDDAKFLVAQLTASFDVATAELKLLEEGTRNEQIAAMRSRLQAAQAKRRNIDVQLADSEIVAPFDGSIARRLVDEGEVVDPNQPILKIIEARPYEAFFGLPPDVAAELHVGDQVHILTAGNELSVAREIEDARDTRLRAKVLRLQSEVDPITRTRGTYCLLDEHADCVPGQTVSLLLPWMSAEQIAGSFWIPTGALVRGSRGLWTVYVAAGSSDTSPNAVIEKRSVDVIRTTGQMSQVKGNVAIGESVVIEGIHRIGPNVLVNVVVTERSLAKSSSGEVTER